MMKKRILRSDRIRLPSGRFSFIPHRFLLDGFLKTLTSDEFLLYVFLVLAADKNGISYYGQKSICSHLHLQESDCRKACRNLIQKDLIAFDGILYQVLELPEKPIIPNQMNQKRIVNLCQSIGEGGMK